MQRDTPSRSAKPRPTRTTTGTTAGTTTVTKTARRAWSRRTANRVRQHTTWKVLRWWLTSMGLNDQLADEAALAMAGALTTTQRHRIEDAYTQHRTRFGDIDRHDDTDSQATSMFEPGGDRSLQNIAALMRSTELGLMRYRHRFDTRRREHVEFLRSELERLAGPQAQQPVELPDTAAFVHLIEVELPTETFPVVVTDGAADWFLFGFMASRSSRLAAQFMPHPWALPLGCNS